MPALSDDIVTRIVGYNQLPGVFTNNTPNLPIAIAIFGQPTEALDSTVDVNTPELVTDIQGVATLYGWGSPIYQAAKELFPNIGGIPVWVFPQQKAVGSAQKIIHLTVTGTATNNGTHYIKISGRTSVGGQSYAVNITSGDTPAVIHGKITDTINNVLGSPMSASDYSYYTGLFSKWNGLDANDIQVDVDTNGNALGLTYSSVDYQSGSGTPDVTASLDLIANRWITHIINGYGLVSTVITQFQDWNGVPVIGNAPATGRYLPTVFKPAIVYSGSVLEDPSSITDPLLNEATIKVSPAPNSAGLPIEAAANDCLLGALQMSSDPSLDVIGDSYIDMPTPETIGAMSSWVSRDAIVKKGCSTVDLVAGAYQIQDPVTTYHPLGETPPQFRYVRNLGVDWNTRFTYMVLEANNVLGKVIANDADVVGPGIQVIKPKIWKAILAEMAENMVARGLWVDAQFTIDSISVSISTVNPDRFRTTFKYKRSGVVRQSDTDATAGFNVGTLVAN